VNVERYARRFIRRAGRNRGREAAPPIAQWGEMALTVLFTLAAVLFFSFLAVVTGLV
jgi:hypothetical protein